MRKMFLSMATMVALLLSAQVLASPAQAAPVYSGPVAGVTTVQDGVASTLEFVPESKRAVQPCQSGQICFYGCYLSGSCGYWFTVTGSSTACTNIYAKHVFIYSIINASNYTHRVWQTSNCTTGGSPTSAIYANTSGNMNSTWDEDAIGSSKKA